MTITPEDKLKCVRREIAMRHRVYPGRIVIGRMTRDEANREVKIMEAIATDYERQVSSDLFEDKL